MTVRVLSVLLGTAVALSAQTNPYGVRPADVDVGRGTFRIYCSPCHGIDASGGRGPDLTTGVYSAGSEDADLYGVIASGVDGTEMPGYGAKMTTNSIWRIVSYLRSVAQPSPPPAAGDPVRGGAVYAAQGCAGCHLIDGEGGSFGPDLSRVGRARSAAFLRESLADPDASLTGGYATVEIVLPDGRKVTGVEESFDNFHVVLTDASGRLHSHAREDLRSAERTGRSTMPSYAERLSAAELDDLVAYLASLGREGSR